MFIIYIQLPPSQHNHYQEKRIHTFLQPLLLNSISKRPLCIHFHIFYFMLLNCSKSRCIKYILWKSKAKRLSIWQMEIKIWMESPNDPELTYLVFDDWNCAGTVCYKRQKNGIKPYPLLTCLYFSTPSLCYKKPKRWSPFKNQKQETYTLCLENENNIFHTAFSTV